MDSTHLLVPPITAWVGSNLAHGLVGTIAQAVAAFVGAVFALLVLLLHLAVVALGILVMLYGFRNQRSKR